jgi:redox-sensitive bicupin YhaK (pirin superfamily)
MIRPHYQEIPAAKIPEAQTPDGKAAVRVIAGESLGVCAVIETRTPIFYLDFTLKPGGTIIQPVARDFNAFAYVIQGPVFFGSHTAHVQRGNMVAFEKDGDQIRIEAPSENPSPARVLLIGGRPLNEPIARYGPFVMNTPQEIRQAFDDYSSGRMGSINP